MDSYRKYFDIDPEFFPAVNNDLIKKDPDLWKKFYPHDTFIGLLKQALSVIERKQKLNIWVEGAYGTGKSHAVLTLKRLLDATEEETNAYFREFNLDDDLRKKFIAAKSSGKIITVHRYGSSSIHSDNDLFLVMQESIEAALKAEGITNAGAGALRTGIINYLSNEENKRSFEVFVKGSYCELFNDESVDDIIDHLSKYTEQALQTLMNKIFKVANEKQIKAFSIDDALMCDWISEVIKVNKLKAIIFIWDEFTEYFSNNIHRLTGFQHVLDLSQLEPFCFIPVTHRSEAGLSDDDTDKKKIKDRFISPTCIIQLPENMAFQLMGKAMQKKDDPIVKADWDNILMELETRTHESRERIKKYAKINDDELKGILPIHPYSACVLKHISASFASNQRSMFDFIKNNGSDEQFGFQWFIDTIGPLDSENPFLTIDMLWGYFYDKGKNDLAQNIRQILDRFSNLSNQLDNEERKVLKTILMFQALSQNAGDAVEIFLPDERNLNLAFEGTDLDDGQAVKCAEKLIRDKVIYKKNLKDGKSLYSVLTGEMDVAQIEKKKDEFRNRTTSTLIKEGGLNQAIELPHDLVRRFKVEYAGITDFDQIARKSVNYAREDRLHFYVVVGLSKDVGESAAMTKKIKSAMDIYADSGVIFIDCGKTPLGKDMFEQWVENIATSTYYIGKDNSESTTYNNYAREILQKWRLVIKQGQFVLFTQSYPTGLNVNSIDCLHQEFKNVNGKRFPLSLEHNFKSISNWWDANSLQVGIECGATKVIKGTYNNKNANLGVALGNAWKEEHYWISHPSEPISRIKSDLDRMIEDELKDNGRISIKRIYEFLTEEPYGFMPCNMTAFFIGFLLKEYVANKYSWSDGLSSDELSLNKLKEMVDEVIKQAITPNSRYRDKFIVTMTSEEKAFIEGTSLAFDISRINCSSVESARDRVRIKMKDSLYFPIWTLNEILDEESKQTRTDIIQELIQGYQDLANNMSGNKTDSDIALSIGKIYCLYPHAAQDLHNLLTHEKCKRGMIRYLDKYKDGELPLIAKQIDDKGQYINELKLKIDAGEANWVWKRQTTDAQIDAVILEYNIILETGKLLGNLSQFKATIAAWNEKCGNLRLSYETIKNDVSDIAPFLSMLRDIKSQGELQESKKQVFLDMLRGYGAQFNAFYQGQLDVFKKSCNFYLQNLSETDKEKVFKKISGSCFTMDNASYCKKVEDLVAEYKKELGSIQLKELWKEKTGTDSPLAWSRRYKMPILIMVANDDTQVCRSVFDIVNSSNPSDKDIEKALNYLEKFKYWDIFNDSNQRDAKFKSIILSDKALMLTDINEVKDYLVGHCSDEPYYWMSSGIVQKVIEQFAQSRYNSVGYATAIQKIDSMNADDVKKYLKELIRNNMSVGIQIIKNN